MTDPKPPKCGRPVGTKMWWMGPDQYDQCYCILLPGHEGECACRHTVSAIKNKESDR